MYDAKRILIIGSAGAGKTTFAIKLSKITDLPLIHLDKEYWQPNWQPLEDSVWKDKVSNLIKGEKWIIDGNYGSTLEIRLAKADLVYFLDYSRFVCVRSVIKRVNQNKGKQRPDLGDQCIEEKQDWEFIKWVWNFPKKYRPKVMDSLNKYSNVKVITFKNRRQAKNYLMKLDKELNHEN